MENELPSYQELKELTDCEILFIVLERLRTISINQTNHLKHSWAVTMVALSAGLMGMINLGIAMVILFFKA